MSISKRLEDARQGFAHGDAALSAAAHDPARIAQAAQERHGAASHQYIGDMVYGGLDGIITTFAVVSWVAGANLGAHVVLILGLANQFADGFSMATGAYLSAKSEKEYYDRERQREAWEVEHYPQGEKAELYELYRHQGYSDKDAARMVEIKSRDPKLWVDAMMVEELGLLPDERTPLLSALTTFIAFIVGGVVPLLVYLAGLFIHVAPQTAFFISLGMSVLALFGLGAAKVMVTRLNPLRSGLEMLVVGGLAGAVAYGMGALLKGIGGG
jgi:VIT1/CCC1 family predicted Fe2+/Mn2+ transporter